MDDDFIYFASYSTILAFGLTESHLEMLKNAARTLTTFDKHIQSESKIKIFATDEVTNIYGIPCFLALINGELLADEDLEGIMDFWKECAEPLPPELVAEGYQEKDFPQTFAYIYNCHSHVDLGINHLKIIKKFFKDEEKLRLTILSELKNVEGKGTASESSIRISRVLRMYKCLFKEGRLTKQRADELSYPDFVSKRMFYKDLRLINDIEYGRVAYDRTIKAYVLKDEW